LTLTKLLRLQGEGDGDTILQPSSVAAHTTSLSSDELIAAIVLVDGATVVAVIDLMLDGADAAFNACAPGYVGIFYRASAGTIENTNGSEFGIIDTGDFTDKSIVPCVPREQRERP
jgi:hypothetical protein